MASGIRLSVRGDEEAVGAELAAQALESQRFLCAQPVAIDSFLRLIKRCTSDLALRVEMAHVLARMVRALPEGALAMIASGQSEALATMDYHVAADLLRGHLANDGWLLGVYEDLRDCAFFSTDDAVIRFHEITMVAMCEMVLLARRASVARAA